MAYDIEFDGDFNELMKQAGDATRLAFKFVAMDALAEIQKEAPVDHGRLHGSFESERFGDFEYHIRTNVEYALWVHEGTGVHGPVGAPYEIVPVVAEALWWPGADHPVMRVLHPGQQPNPFAQRGLDTTATRLEDFAQMALDQTVGG